MLTILVEGVDPVPAGMAMDIERVFDTLVLSGDNVERSLIREIEQGEYYDQHRFIDRMGVTLDRMYLSTGCKAAICVHHLPNTPLCCIEAGDNALEAITTHCTEGIIYVPNRTLSFTSESSTPIDTLYKGKYYTSLDAFEDYMQNEWEA